MAIKNIVVFFIEGALSQEFAPHRDESELFAWLADLELRYQFSSATGGSLASELEVAFHSWEYFVGSFASQSIDIRVWRAYPDWGFEVHHGTPESLRAFEDLMQLLGNRLFASPFHIAVVPATREPRTIVPPLYVTSQSASWRIHRTTQQYSSMDVHVGADERLIIEEVADTSYEQVLEALLYIEYDLRIMHRNLLDMVSLQAHVGSCNAQTEMYTMSLLYQTRSGGLQDLSPRITTSLVESKSLLSRVTTLAADTFTAALDVLDYCVDLNGFLDDTQLAQYYSTQAELCYAKAKLLLSPIEWSHERLEYLSLVANRS